MGSKTSGSFVKGDKRINRRGRPKSFDALRQLAQTIAHEDISDGMTVTVAVYSSVAKSFAQLQALGYEVNGFTVNPSYASTVYGGFALPGGNALKNAGYYLGGADTTPDVGREGSVWNGRGYS